MYCIYCGYQLPDDALFCMKCGKPQQPNTHIIENYAREVPTVYTHEVPLLSGKPYTLEELALQVEKDFKQHKDILACYYGLKDGNIAYFIAAQSRTEDKPNQVLVFDPAKSRDKKNWVTVFLDFDIFLTHYNDDLTKRYINEAKINMARGSVNFLPDDNVVVFHKRHGKPWIYRGEDIRKYQQGEVKDAQNIIYFQTTEDFFRYYKLRPGG